jgi:site-specific DNA-methyltransferase (adenine-specific)
VGFIDRGIEMTTDTESVFSFIDTYAETTDKLYLEAIIEVCGKWVEGEAGTGC